MKKQFLHVGSVLLVICSIAFTLLASCKKNNNAIAGTYAGAVYTTGGSPADTVIITAGSSLTTFVVSDKYAGAVINANGLTDSLTVPAQQIMINGIPFTWFGAGSVSDNTLDLSLFYIRSNDTVAYYFTGTRH